MIYQPRSGETWSRRIEIKLEYNKCIPLPGEKNTPLGGNIKDSNFLRVNDAVLPKIQSGEVVRI